MCQAMPAEGGRCSGQSAIRRGGGDGEPSFAQSTIHPDHHMLVGLFARDRMESLGSVRRSDDYVRFGALVSLGHLA